MASWGIHQALWRAARPNPLLPLSLRASRPPPAKVPAKVIPIGRRRHRAPRVPPPPPPSGELETKSAWDPDEPPARTGVRTPFEEEMLLQEINGCKLLLLEMVRRAAYDWVLYRGSRRLVQRSLAEQAYRWLFLETPEHPDWAERHREGKDCTSFVAVCESLDIVPERAREHIRRLTAKNVMSVGRPAEYRRRDVFSSRAGEDDVYSTPGVLVDYNEVDPGDGFDGGDGY
jgi:hypothetical protein